MAVTRAATIAELQKLAKLRVPRMFYDYCDSGSWTESTYQLNETDFSRIKFRQRVARDIAERTVETTMIGQAVSMPCALAPIGMCGMQYPDGEISAAKAAAKYNVPFTLSTMSICSIEEVAEASPTPFWFQLYVMKDKVFVKNLIDRAKRAECSALVLTLDLQLLGDRHKDKKNGLSAPPKPTLRSFLDLATHPRWCFNMLSAKRYNFGNICGHVEGVDDTSSLSSWAADQFDLRLNWDDVARIKDMWGGKLIIKGIFDPEDARHCVTSELADAMIVSNHGGRQLDGADSSISMLSKIAESIKEFKQGKDVEIWMDGGIRSGQDVLRAIALGASGTMLGRSYVYGLGAGGQEGVERSLEIIRTELDKTMALCGYRDINLVTRDILTQDCPF